jgi:predicted SAM-dependent methyltransferase
MNLNIGASQTRIDGFVNIDVAPGADLQIDLNSQSLPYPDNSVDCVFSSHTFEHFDNYIFALGEVWRVLKHGARLFVSVPYVTLTEYNLVNPYHKHHFNELSFDFFEIGKLKGSATEDNPILFTKVWHRFLYLPEFAEMPEPERTFARRHYFNVVRAIDFGLYAVKPPSIAIEVPESAAAEFQREFDRIDRMRVPVVGRRRGGREGKPGFHGNLS